MERNSMMSLLARHGRRTRLRTRPAHLPLVAAILTAVTVTAAPTAGADETNCGGTHFVASWAASPTDALAPVDAAGAPVPLAVADQTFRMIITPHLGGTQLRVRLTNRYGLGPVTFARVSVGNQVAGAAVDALTPVSFDGGASVTVAAGAEILSDPVPFAVAAFRPVAVSIHVAGVAGPPTKHWNANATSYYAGPNSGDLTGQPGPEQFASTTGSWLYVSALDVRAQAATRSVVAFGDSITDGFVGTSAIPVPVDRAVADVNGRYPDALQRRLDAAGIPISVVNAGIGSNRVLTSGEPLMPGASGLARFERDALEQSGVAGVLVQEGINDLGLPPAADAAGMIAGYQQLIAMAHGHGKKIWLGTLLPASDALVDGVALAPRSESDRQQINAWIRGQRIADGVVDFDVALRDPDNPSVLRDDYSGPDRLHPNLAGYRAMADVIDLGMLSTAGSPRC
ncbi:GDSL-type esterase/lipase family protein [Nocardia bovistercoris]|uniref:GDSL family lipase n=1 Tax=Nocardia bovistercoris TaxID=2785916 RepID=A0A931N3A6_9NOCA|nr:GDSL-type esterase/lipase family protein [Nocardia bovistercoris]MBH0776363.1 GDSL family lipase [Nocardia bovistercoris]